MKRRAAVMAGLVVCLTFVSYVYIHQDDQEIQESDVFYQNVVFSTVEGDLVPISINFHSQVELEEEVRNKIDFMKSNDLISYGLNPLLSNSLEVQSVELKNHILTVSFNDELYSNKDALNILEALTYTLTNDDIHQLHIQIDEKDVAYLPNSTIPLNSLTKDLGLNNFEESSNLLHQTIPVMVYNQKTIQQYMYYVPTTVRIDENESLKTQVQTILSYVQGKIHLIDAQLNDAVLTVNLDSNILLDNEKIDQTLEDLIVLSLTSLKDVNDVEIKINGEDVRTKPSSQIQYNYIKM